MGEGRDGDAPAFHDARTLRERRGRDGRRRRALDLRRREVRAPPRIEAGVGPRQRVPPQPEHPAVGEDRTPMASEVDASTRIEASREALADRLFEAGLGMLDTLVVYLGDRLGLYRALAGGDPTTANELASRAGIHERYAREWLEHQAAAGILEVDDPAATPDERRFRLPPA